MANARSPLFLISEKVGFLVGKCLRVVVVGGIFYFISRMLTGSTSSQPVPGPPAPPAL
jgi:hypothetical protein